MMKNRRNGNSSVEGSKIETEEKEASVLFLAIKRSRLHKNDLTQFQANKIL